MRFAPVLVSLLVSAAAEAATSINIFIGEPTQRIAIENPVYPELVRVPNYPVYYAPRARSNIFFYDGLYWAYHDDRWYASTWYNGPWGLVDPVSVPSYVLRVPVRYYRDPPAYFKSWAVDAPPRWDVHWGSSWSQQRTGWSEWNRSSVPAPAPLPVYQREYTRDRYPDVQQQLVLQNQRYTYTPRETAVKSYYASTVRTSGASAHAPGQIKKQQGAQSARDFAPGHVKKQQQEARGKPERDDDDDDHGHGHGNGHGKGKGKGHGKD